MCQSIKLAAWQISLMTILVRKTKKAKSTMSEISHHHDDKGDDPFNYSHDTCPTCQDLLIVESDVEGCDNASSANPVILVALNVSADGMKSKRWWKVF